MRVWCVSILLASVALLGACGRGDAQRTGQAAVDRIFPGDLTVIGARSLGLAGPGYRLTAALRDDPDAAVRFVLRPSDDDCGPGSVCEEQIRTAVRLARAEATGLRALLGAFASCGHPIIGLRSAATIAARVDDDSVGPLVADLDRCVAAWTTARGDALGERARLDLDIVDPDVAAAAPVPDPALPTAARLDDDELFAALTSRSRYTASITVIDGRPEPVASVLRPVLEFDEKQAFDAPVVRAATEWMRQSGIVADPGLPPFVLDDATRLIPGSTQRLRVYVALCTPPCPDGGDNAAVALTVDRAGTGAADFRLLPLTRLPRDAGGLFDQYHYPLEPDLR